MTHRFVGVSWNRHKLIYDGVLIASVALYLGVFLLAGSIVFRGSHAISPPILLIRALATCGLLMLHIVLSIGPLSRIDSRFLMLLYNRRHLGVATFLVIACHGLLVTLYYGGFGGGNPLLNVLAGNTQYSSFTGFPFEAVGFIGFVILFFMAATSHDFWLSTLSPVVWKTLHMLVYPAYAAIVAHVALGALQSEKSLVYPVMLGAGVAWLTALHLFAGVRSARRSRAACDPQNGMWLDAGAVNEYPTLRAREVRTQGGAPIAVYNNNGAFSAVSGVCAHQMGPIAEGRIVDGCITCPWHGYQYDPVSGASPPPYTEKIASHRVRIEQGRVSVCASPQSSGEEAQPARPDAQAGANQHG